MKSISARRLKRLPRALSQRSRALLGGREASGFGPCVRFDPDAPQLILSPHCDDAVLSCWSVLTSSQEVAVVNVFTGSPQPGQAGVWEAVSGCADSAERARGRIAEDAVALARAGRSARNLPLLDVSSRRRRPELGLAAFDRALAAQLDSASRVYAPAGIGRHVDHVLTRRYAQALAHAGMPVELYAELPYCVFHGWPSWVDGCAREPDRDVDAYWQSFLQDVPEMPALEAGEVTRLQEPAIAAKLEALSCYRLSLNYAVKQLLANPLLGRFEVRWRLSPRGTFTPAHTDGR
jgi:hypothetical protein